MPQVPKLMTEEGLQKDLSYLQGGIDCHAVLADVCAPRPGLKVLEPGCGSGKLGLFYALRGARVVLTDIDAKAIEYAQELWRRALLTQGRVPDDGPRFQPIADFMKGIMPPGAEPVFKVESIHRICSPDGQFDFVFNEGVPHHWGYNPYDWRRQRAINEMARVTKPGGAVCVIGSNAHCPETVKMAEQTDHSYRGMPPKQKPFTRIELVERLEKAGLEGLGVMPVLPRGAWVSHDFSDSPLIAGWGWKP